MVILRDIDHWQEKKHSGGFFPADGRVQNKISDSGFLTRFSSALEGQGEAQLQLVVSVNVELVGADPSVFVLVVLPQDVVQDFVVVGLVALLALFLLVLLPQVFLNLDGRKETEQFEVIKKKKKKFSCTASNLLALLVRSIGKR